MDEVTLNIEEGGRGFTVGEGGFSNLVGSERTNVAINGGIDMEETMDQDVDEDKNEERRGMKRKRRQKRIRVSREERITGPRGKSEEKKEREEQDIKVTCEDAPSLNTT